MKQLTFFAVVLSTLVAIPLLIQKNRQRVPVLTDEDKRYDIEDFIAEEAL
ncbi:MAG TPA: hypothetical protein VII11_02410 [Bacteroidota bacterium]